MHREKDEESSDQNRGGEVGAEATLVHKEAGAETEWKAASGPQVRRALLSEAQAAPSPEAAETAHAGQADGRADVEAAGLRKTPHQLVHT